MQLTIEKLVYGGDGLAHLPGNEHGPGKAVFVPFSLDGETVEVAIAEEKPGFARGRLESIIQPSPDRVQPGCPYFQHCGGCHYQHSSYEHQLTVKAAILKETLRRITKLTLHDLTVHPSPPWNYRNRTRLQVRTSPDFAVGYYRFNSHQLLPVEQCPISSPLLNRAITAVWELANAGGFEAAMSGSEIELFANADDSSLLIELYCPPEVRRRTARALTDKLQSLLPEVAGVSAFRSQAGQKQPETLIRSGAGEIAYQTGTASYRVSAGGFFQINRYLIDKLVKIATCGRSGDTALDLYAGAGLFSTVLSREFKQVIAVERSPISYADLSYNSPANVQAVQAMTEQYLKHVSGKLQPDLVVLDPPRGGLGKSVVHSLVSLGAPRITYVSCDPATLSRDLTHLLEGGYRVEQTHLVDLFPQTYHLESVFHLVR